VARRGPVNESLLDKFKKALRTGSAANKQKGAVGWFKSKIQQGMKLAKRTYKGARGSAIAGMSGMTPKELLTQYPKFKLKNGTKVQVRGQVFFFQYDAKYKATLPYWDRFPMAIPFDFKPPHLYAINLHYLPPMARANLMDELQSRMNNKKMDETTFIKADWDTLKKIDEVFPCVKKYLLTHIKLAIKIPADEWDVALFLPVARFQKKSEKFVWKDSMARIGG
jgi:hypothetical protein